MTRISDSDAAPEGSWSRTGSQARTATLIRCRTEVGASKNVDLAPCETSPLGCKPLKRDRDGAGTRRLTILDRFRRSQKGVAALEFALVAPFLIALFLGGFELTRYITAVRKLTNMANVIAEMVAQNTTGSVNGEDILFYLNSAVIDFPQVLDEARIRNTTWGSLIQTTVSSIHFTPQTPGCTSNCTYDAYPTFSGGGNQRRCYTKLTPVASSAPSTPSTLPLDAYGPGAIIVVDVTYTYHPRVATQIFGDLPIRRSFYVQPRYVPDVGYDFTAGWAAQACA